MMVVEVADATARAGSYIEHTLGMQRLYEKRDVRQSDKVLVAVVDVHLVIARCRLSVSASRCRCTG